MRVSSFFHRTYWLYGQNIVSGFSSVGQFVPVGQILVCPVWDGMIAAEERFYMSAVDGSVRCFQGEMQ